MSMDAMDPAHWCTTGDTEGMTPLALPGWWSLDVLDEDGQRAGIDVVAPSGIGVGDIRCVVVDAEDATALELADGTLVTGPGCSHQDVAAALRRRGSCDVAVRSAGDAVPGVSVVPVRILEGAMGQETREAG